MLGRLLSTAASTLNPAAYSGKTPHHLESVTEEEHTSGLLFPDASLLRRSNTHAYPLHSTFNSPNASTAGAYDDRGGVELDTLKDFRVIIAQNALGDRDACVLLDTRASSPDSSPHGLGLEPQVFENPGVRHARTVSNLTSRGARRGYLSQSSAAEPSPLSMAAETHRSPPMSSGAFVRARGRSSTFAPPGGFHDTGHSRHPADSNDIGLLNCIFGSSAFSYRGSSTKMHIISADDEPSQTGSSSSPATRNSLSRAYTTGSPSTHATPNRGPDPKPPAKVTVLLTRMFSVNLPEAGETSPDRPDAPSIYQESLPEAGFPFPDIAKRKKIKEKKTPMYAVAITIQIPLLGRSVGRPGTRLSTQAPDYPRPGMSCSLDSDYRWRAGFLDDSLSLASAPASLDERIDLLVDHWDVINRTLSHLETLSRREILFLLKKVDASHVQPKPPKVPNMQRTNQTIIHLPTNILAVNSKLKDEAVRSTRRISTALQTPYVVTGQSRWGVWREEGRSIVRNIGDKEHSFFFLVLITAFLGNHTEWLNALGPEWYRRRHYLQQRAQQQDSDPILANRTVIISPDKMTARRLIFLLSAFLPPKQRFEPPLPSPLRPGTSTSTRAVSQSPPTVPVLRQESLRRAIERKSRAQRLNLADQDQHQRSVSVSSSETAHRSTEDDPVGPMEFATNRRDSDARSIRTLGVPMNVKDVRNNKNTGVATTSTATPASAVPVPHFTAQRRLERENSDQSVPEGQDSLASENLLKNLQRSDSSIISGNSSVPSPSGRWGSLFSGLWSTRQETSSTGNEDILPAEARRRSVSAAYNAPSNRAPPSLGQMVKEASSVVREEPPKATASGHISIPNSNAHGEQDTQDLSLPISHTRESSLKLSVRGDDGIVDVDLPLPGFVSLSSSGDSTMASPKKTRTSVTSVDALASTHSSGSGFHHAPKETEGPNINVAGWLRVFHEDFLLQAVRPYASLEADIKRAMRAEPTPSQAFATDAYGSERWVDVATTLVADARTCTVKRIRLRRKAVGWRSLASPSIGSQPGTPRHISNNSTFAPHVANNAFSPISGPNKSSPIVPPDDYDPEEVEERIVEEPVMDLDGTLVDALERVLAQSGPSSLAPTRAPSPSRSRKGDDKITPDAVIRDEMPSLEVPRTECRKLVLGALEEVVRSVTAEHCREDVDGELGLADRERRRTLAGPENTLREGVRNWLLDVEEAW
ncbi:hypothetical protein FE257_010643 [Aspergillus nanangensis]|uniref:Folliculin-interacting protein N-terminal domain-containing protein n=1 Tax=Aspergillus nanangensis TaxID=2582783 RepID=A0AAD4CK24_ASPNN|nr:hypothetical protein FE257_010643 [Aspergillus nanangensis]